MARATHLRGSASTRLLLTSALLLAAGALSPAAASSFRIRLDDRAADLVTTAFERSAVNDRLLRDILTSDGYRLVFDQEAVETRPRRDPEEVAREFRAALEAASRGDPDPGFELQHIRARPERYREALRDFRRIAGRIRWEVTDRLNAFLPPASGFTSTAHLVVGGRVAGVAFSDRDDIALRLDDFVSRRDGEALDVDRLAAVLGHELFHVGFRAAGGLPPRPDPIDLEWLRLARRHGPDVVGEVWRASGLQAWDGGLVGRKLAAWVPPPAWEPQALDRYLALLTRLQNEGCAVYVEAPLRNLTGTGRHADEIQEWTETIGEDFAYFSRVTARLARGAGPEEIEQLSREGFRESGPLYRVGYRMADRIDRHAGRRPLLATISGGPLEFFETYFETHPYGPAQVDSATEDEIRRIIREIRAVGAFDPGD